MGTQWTESGCPKGPWIGSGTDGGEGLDTRNGFPYRKVPDTDHTLVHAGRLPHRTEDRCPGDGWIRMTPYRRDRPVSILTLSDPDPTTSRSELVLKRVQTPHRKYRCSSRKNSLPYGVRF